MPHCHDWYPLEYPDVAGGRSSTLYQGSVQSQGGDRAIVRTGWKGSPKPYGGPKEVEVWLVRNRTDYSSDKRPNFLIYFRRSRQFHKGRAVCTRTMIHSPVKVHDPFTGPIPVYSGRSTSKAHLQIWGVDSVLGAPKLRSQHPRAGVIISRGVWRLLGIWATIQANKYPKAICEARPEFQKLREVPRTRSQKQDPAIVRYVSHHQTHCCIGPTSWEAVGQLPQR